MHHFAAFNHVKAMRHGMLIYNHLDQYVGQSIEMYGEFSEGEVELFCQIIKPGHVVLDIGANIGAHTLLFARLAAPNGAVIAVEPQRVLFQTLCGNMAINSVTNAYCHCAAVGDHAGSIKVPQVDYGRIGNFGAMSLGGNEPGENIPLITIDSMNLRGCDFIKVDVEGMEVNVVRGAAATIARLHPILYVENDRQDKSRALIEYIASLDYHMFWHKPAMYNPRNFAKNGMNLFGNIVSKNMICVHASRKGQFEPSFKPVDLPAAS